MALNLWKIGGQSTSYNPLSGSPFASVSPNTDYVLTLYARSASNGSLQLNTQGIVLTSQSLTSQRTFYTFNLKPTQTQLYFTDLGNKGDIIIDNIVLVQKPLPKLTLNGVDGFSSGKWIIHPRATVLDDTTLSTDATDAWQSTALYNVPVIGGKSYYFSAYVTSSGGTQSGLLIGWYDANGTNLNPGNSWGCVSTSSTEVMVTGSLTAPNTAVRAGILVSSSASGIFKVRQPVMNLGSLVPYSRKTGDKMVLPIPTKNLMVGFKNSKWILSGSATAISDDTLFINSVSSTVSILPNILVKPSTNYVISVMTLPVNSYIAYIQKDIAGNQVVGETVIIPQGGSQASFKTNINTAYVQIQIYSNVNGQFTIQQPQLEEGTSATTYTPYDVQANKKAKKPIVKARTGLSFNGVSDYLQLPSMTMDSVEIDCLIDSTQFNGGWHRLIDVSSSSAYYFITNNFAFYGTKLSMLSGGISIGTRSTVRLSANIYSSDTVSLFGFGGGDSVKGTLYKVTCYLNNQIVAQYDFEKPSNIVGTSVLQNANNLIPNFEDARWNLHANTQVLGKHYLRLNATASSNVSYSTINVSPNTNFIFTNTTNGYCCVANADGSINLLGWSSLPSRTFNSGSNSVIRIYCGNYNGVFVSGTFEFSKPQLYALSGTEGTLNGTPISARKQSRRTQYAKR
jgi:hypothetical protein